MKRLWPLAIFVLVLSSCSVSSASGDRGRNLSFSWFVAYNWFSPPNAWGKDPISAWLLKNKKISVQWISGTGVSTGFFDRLLSGEDFPDVICVDRGSLVSRLADAGLILPLDPYLRLMPNLQKWAGAENLNLLRHSDGKLYQFPNWYISPQAGTSGGNCAWAINTEIYQALGSPPLSTFDDLETYLLRVKEHFPETIALETCDSFQIASLVYRAQDANLRDNMTNYLGTPRDGSFTSLFRDPYVQDTLLYLSRLFRKGLITPDAFTQTRDQVIEKLLKGSVAVIATWDAGAIISPGNSGSPPENLKYKVIWPPVKKGVDPASVAISGFQTLGWNVNVFSVRAKDRIEQILTYLDWLTGEEGQRILTYGPPEYFWDKTDEAGIPIWNDRFMKASQSERDGANMFKWNWVGNTTFVNRGKIVANNRLPPNKQDAMIKWQSDIIWKTSRNENEFAYTRPSSDSKLGTIQTKIADIYDDTIAKSVFALSDQKVLSILATAQAQMDAAGYGAFLEYHNQKYRERVQEIKNTPAFQK